MRETAPGPWLKPGRRRVVTVVFIVSIVLIAGVGFLSPWFDSFAPQWVRCEIVSAEAVQANNRSVTPWRVEIRTADCNTIGYLKIPTQEEAEKLAAQLEPGSAYEFELGMISRMMSKSPFAVITPSAKDLRPAAAGG